MMLGLTTSLGLELADPELLLVGLMVPLALVLRALWGRPAVLFGPGKLLAPEDGRPLPRTWRLRLRFAPPAILVLGLVLAAFALARPVERVAVPQVREGIDVLLGLDVSSSMAANDLDPERSRLEVAKAAARRFVAGRPDDRIGLVCFARYPDLRCPLTLDHQALTAFIDAVTLVEADGPEDATGIGTATVLAAKALEGGAEDSRVVVLFTDGEENVATADKPKEIAPLHAGQLCAKLGVRVYPIVAGLGRRDHSGEWVALDTRQVRSLARLTRGRFFEARDTAAVSGVFDEIDSLTKAEFEEPRHETRERYLPFLLAALGFVVLGRLGQGGPGTVLP
jgi:Ca-activated chloride channel family protein